MPVLTGSVHAHILTNSYRAGFAVIRLELAEADEETCLVDQVNSPSPTDQPVRKFKDGLAISMTMKKLFAFWTYLFFGTHTASTTDGVNRTRPKRTMLKAASQHPWVRRSLSVPDDVKRKRKKAMAVAESERVAKRDREEAIQGERDHQEYMERSV